MVAAAEFTGICPRCGGDLSSQVVKPERFACIYCGWRCYGSSGRRSPGEGRVLRLRYLGASPPLTRFPPLAALMAPGDGTEAQSRMGLRIACPLCRGAGVLSVMNRRGQSFERWRCGVGHRVRLHLAEREEIIGWS